MAGVGAMFTGLRVAGAEDDGFRDRSTSAVSRSGTLQQSGCREQTTLGRWLAVLSVEGEAEWVMGELSAVFGRPRSLRNSSAPS